MSGGFYRAFEDRYRGSRDIISERLAVYLPFVQPLAGDGAAALDLGCGRGEWLELLVKAGFTAEGVDLDEGMLAACRERGLQVVNGDALAALRARPDDSLAVVSAFHLVEHISFEQVQVLIAEALRALQPGGLLILETPNPENLVVGTSSFYDDPSHLKPVPSKLLAFAVEFSGFGRHKVLRLQEPEHLRDGAGIALFDVLAGVSPDYGIVAQKAGGPAHLAVLDTLFEAHYGLDLHELAQRYEQQQDAVHSELGQLREAHELRGRALQGQLASVDAQIAHVHATTVAFAADLAGAELARSALAERLCQLCEAHELSGRAVQGQLASVDAQIAHVHATTVAFAADLAGAELARSALAARLDKIESLGLHPDHAASLSKRLEQVENLTAQLDQVESLAVRLDGIEARSRQLDTGGGEQPSLRLRLSDLQKQHQEAVDESARLAAHVAWIEGRLTHAEAQAAALRHQLADAQRNRIPGLRLLRALRERGRRAAGGAAAARLRQLLRALLRRLIQGVLRRPALKRMARSMVTRFPQLHTRLMRLMYAPAPVDPAPLADADPLASEMSPRSLAIYRALLAASNNKD